MPPRILTVALLLLASASLAKDPPPAPAEELPRQTLEKLYAAELPKFDPANYQKLYDAHLLLEKYFLTDSKEDRQTIQKLLKDSQLDLTTLGRMCRIHLGWPALPPGPIYVNERIGPHDVHYFLGVPKDYDRSKSWPLVVRLPAATAIIKDPKNLPTPDDVFKHYPGWVAEELKFHPDAIVIMPLLNLGELYGPSYKGMNTVIQAMHHVMTRANIDPKQVYMVGHGTGGHATWNLALHYPTYFAAINPLAGAASGDWQRVRMLNLRNTLPIIWHDSDDKVIPPAQSGALVSILRTHKYDLVFEQTRGVGHTPSAQIMEKCYAAMRARTRDLYPKQVSLRSTRPDPTFNRADWVQVYQPLDAGAERQMMMRRGTGRIIVNENAHSIEATLNGNKIEAKTVNVQTLRFYLNDQMMDLAKPVTIIVNNKTRFEGMVKPSLEEMLNDQVFLERGWRYFTAVVDLDLGVPSTTRPTTNPTSRPVIATTTGTRLFFTIDDGKTWFAADASNKAPFTNDGKQALRAHVFQCAGKPPFIGYLSKHSSIAGEDMVKKAGETRWFPHSTPNAAGIMTIKCGEGPGAKPAIEIFPQ